MRIHFTLRRGEGGVFEFDFSTLFKDITVCQEDKFNSGKKFVNPKLLGYHLASSTYIIRK